MQQIRILLAVAGLALGLGCVVAQGVQLTAGVGFGGYYRPNTLVPVIVEINNPDSEITGELRVLSDDQGALPDTYRFPVVIPKGAKWLRFLYIIPHSFTSDIKVELRGNGLQPVRAIIQNCKQVSAETRLVAVVGGTGSSLSFLNGQSLTVLGGAQYRPWDMSGYSRDQYRYGYGYGGAPYGGGGKVPGNMNVVNIPPALLPDNPEAYGSLAALMLMSDVTENTLSKGSVRDAISMWVVNGGHLVVAGGGVPSRLEAPFFAGLLPLHNGKPLPEAESMTNTDGGIAVMMPRGAGWTTALTYDPDAVAAADWHKAAAFYGKLFAKAPSIPFTQLFAENINNAIMPSNIKPPDLKLIVAFLLIYLVLLVPVNYFVLRKLDKRELAWVTTPAIVLIFTIGAYGIGLLTKGSTLLLHSLTMVETCAGQSSAEATSSLLIFSPSRTNYRLALGESGLLAKEAALGNEYDYRGNRTVKSPLTYKIAGNDVTVEGVHVNMWDFRQFTMAHTLDLGEGFTASLTPSSSPSASAWKGTITNKTPYRYSICELYYNGARVAEFSLEPGEIYQINATRKATAQFTGPNQQHIFDVARGSVQSKFTSSAALKRGAVLITYSADPAAHPAFKVTNHAPTAAITVMAVHL